MARKKQRLVVFGLQHSAVVKRVQDNDFVYDVWQWDIRLKRWRCNHRSDSGWSSQSDAVPTAVLLNTQVEEQLKAAVGHPPL